MIYKRILHNYVKSVVEYLMIWEDSLISEKKNRLQKKKQDIHSFLTIQTETRLEEG